MKKQVLIRDLPNNRGYKNQYEIDRQIEKLLNDCFIKVYGNRVEEVIESGSTIVIKPNFVHEMNFNVSRDGKSIENANDCFISSNSVIKAVLKFLNRIHDAKILIVESPIQFCRISQIVSEEILQEWKEIFTNGTVQFIDLRRTIMQFEGNKRRVLKELRENDQYIDFDLGKGSYFCGLEKLVHRFRVTDYPPRTMREFHSADRHIYRIAKEIIDTDWIINIPKLKAHQKAGITGAMKNFIGVVGNKECLPHHIKGSPLTGGTCHSDCSILKLIAENLIDIANTCLEHKTLYLINSKAAAVFMKIHSLISDNQDLSGSWYGNTTIARTINDINKIVYYGKIDGTIGIDAQRNIITLVDAMVVGEGDGPMRPFPVYKNLLLCGNDTLAVDIVNASILGFDFRKIPQISIGLSAVNLEMDIYYNNDQLSLDELQRRTSDIKVKPAPGWVGMIEL